MAAKKIGTVIREARTAAGLTQEQLARKVTGVSAADLRKVEAGEADFTQAQLKALAKPLGVTQKSLLDAPKNVAAKKPAASTTAKKPATSTTAKKPAASTTAKKPAASTTAKKPAASTTAKKPAASTTAKKPAASTAAAAKTPKTPANANSTMKVTAAERKLIESYRTASGAAKKAAAKLLKGEREDLLDDINGTGAGGLGGVAQDLLGGVLGNLLGGK